MIWKYHTFFVYSLVYADESYPKILARMGDRLHLPLTTERLSKLTENYIVDNSKLEKALKKKLPIEASDGLKHTLESFESQRIDLRD